ncbi:MAG: restriction endonuclease subunit S [Desulfamplus sp.]|nr:restriction endonuclease subunit S [Desulfamplus sp.]
MKIKQGYKQTEVGLIPDDWEVKVLADCCIKITDGTHDTPKPVKSGVPFLTAIHVKENHIDYVNCYYLPDEVHRMIYNRYNPEKNDVLMVNIGAGVATTALVTVNYEFSLKNVALLKPDNSQLIGAFLNYWQLKSKLTIINSISTGGAQPFLSLNQIGCLKIALPTLTEQTTIANALSDADALITSLEKLIAKKRNIKQGAMQKLLQPKEGWKVKRLVDFLDYEQPTEYLVTNTEYDDNNQTPVLTAGKTFILGYTNEEHGIFTNLPVIIFDDFTTAIKYVEFPFKAKSSAMKMLIPKNESVNLRFIYEIMLQIKYPLGDHKRHWIAEYRNLEIKIPPTQAEQTRIATILSDMDNEITALENKLEKYKKIKLGMMQNLLTGRIRLI